MNVNDLIALTNNQYTHTFVIIVLLKGQGQFCLLVLFRIGDVIPLQLIRNQDSLLIPEANLHGENGFPCHFEPNKGKGGLWGINPSRNEDYPEPNKPLG